jgi:flagellar hook protein FlgE
MSLFNTLNTGITGLGSNGLSMSVIGDNISNLNTVGYKGSQAEFQDLILQQLGGGRGQLGQGSFTGKVAQVFGQGSLENSANGTDMAIDGRGFFVVADADGNEFFSRAGQFRLDSEGYLANVAGAKLQGYPALADGSLSTAVGDLQIGNTPIPGTATTSVMLDANLSSGARDGTVPVAVPPAVLTSGDVSTAASFTTSTVAYDSLGAAHDVTMAYFKNAVGDWDFRAYVNGGDIGGNPDEMVEIATGSLQFDGAGVLDTAASSVTSSAVTFDGANAQTIAFDFGLGANDTGVLTQTAGDSTVTEVDPNGNGAGSLASFDIGSDGLITGVYTNGETRELGQVVLATFQSEQNLSRVGHNMYAATRESGEAAIGTADSGGRGVVHGYALEMSNVDIEKQFVKMIQSQKGYQASARVVSGADELLQELMQIV